MSWSPLRYVVSSAAGLCVARPQQGNDCVSEGLGYVLGTLLQFATPGGIFVRFCMGVAACACCRRLNACLTCSSTLRLLLLFSIYLSVLCCLASAPGTVCCSRQPSATGRPLTGSGPSRRPSSTGDTVTQTPCTHLEKASRYPADTLCALRLASILRVRVCG